MSSCNSQGRPSVVLCLALFALGAWTREVRSLFVGDAARTAEEREILAHMSLVRLEDASGRPGATTLRISGLNVQIVSGSGSTDGRVNGVGNLILGYDEPPRSGDCDRSGSHNLVLGRHHQYSSYGGLIAGSDNWVREPYSSITGGSYNRTFGEHAVVCGGENCLARGRGSSTHGGSWNASEGELSVVAGGEGNAALGRVSTVCGGGGFEVEANIAWADYSWVGGGRGNVAQGYGAAIVGGLQNDAQAPFSTIVGGSENWIWPEAQSALAAGGGNNVLRGGFAVTVGGSANQADALYATAVGGRDNRAEHRFATLRGGCGHRSTAECDALP